MNDTEVILHNQLHKRIIKHINAANDVLAVTSYTDFELGKKMLNGLLSVQYDIEKIIDFLCDYNVDKNGVDVEAYNPFKHIPDDYRPDIERKEYSYHPDLIQQITVLKRLQSDLSLINSMLSDSVSEANNVTFNKKKEYLNHVLINKKHLDDCMLRINNMKTQYVFQGQ